MPSSRTSHRRGSGPDESFAENADDQFGRLPIKHTLTGSDRFIIEDSVDKWKKKRTSIFAISASTDYPPVSVNVATGILDAGDVDSLEHIDGNTLDVSEVSGVPGYMIEINYADVLETPTQLDLFVCYNGALGHTVNVEIFNQVTMAWDFLGTIPSDGGVFEFLEYEISDGGTYVKGDDTVEVRINHVSSGNPTHDITIDLALLRNIPGGGTGSSTLASLTDVVLSGPSDLDLLQYDLASGKWVDRTLAEAGIDIAKLAGIEAGADVTDTANIVAAGAVTFFAYPNQGDVLAGTGLVSPAILPLGADGEVIVADRSQTSGLKWDAVSVPGSITIESPSVGDAFQIRYTGAKGLTVTEVSAFTDVSGSTVTLNIEERSDRYSVGTDVIDIAGGDLVADFDGQTASGGELVNAGIAADRYMVVTISAISATLPGSVTINFKATQV